MLHNEDNEVRAHFDDQWVRRALERQEKRCLDGGFVGLPPHDRELARAIYRSAVITSYNQTLNYLYREGNIDRARRSAESLLVSGPAVAILGTERVEELKGVIQYADDLVKPTPVLLYEIGKDYVVNTLQDFYHLIGRLVKRDSDSNSAFGEQWFRQGTYQRQLENLLD